MGIFCVHFEGQTQNAVAVAVTVLTQSLRDTNRPIHLPFYVSFVIWGTHKSEKLLNNYFLKNNYKYYITLIFNFIQKSVEKVNYSQLINYIT